MRKLALLLLVLLAAAAAPAEEPFITVVATDYVTGKIAALGSAAPWAPSCDLSSICSDAASFIQGTSTLTSQCPYWLTASLLSRNFLDSWIVSTCLRISERQRGSFPDRSENPASRLGTTHKHPCWLNERCCLYE